VSEGALHPFEREEATLSYQFAFGFLEFAAARYQVAFRDQQYLDFIIEMPLNYYLLAGSSLPCLLSGSLPDDLG